MKFDIVIIGGGHAGAEAAWIASQFPLKVALISLPNLPLGSMPCNPSIGGVGKGQLVRELAVLGGLMPEIADRSAIQYRTLNESKGPAVHSTRVQADIYIYPQELERALLSRENITIIRSQVDHISKGGTSWKITLADNEIESTSLIITTGTFLAGLLHRGEVQSAGGRDQAMASRSLATLFSGLDIVGNRFKTGTPPRLDSRTLDFSKFVVQESDSLTSNFSLHHRAKERFVKQTPCYLTHTNERTLDIIRSSRERSPLFNGQIAGIGPRYCPSIEDKAFRYPDRNSHHVFIEPESLTGHTIYPNGLSTSLPIDIQDQFIRSIEGLESAKIVQYGYAVEYDVIDSSTLKKTLEHKDIPSIYFAGQVNGSSGYEEAAAQGFVAGVNAALKIVHDRELIFSRNDSYIGVLIDDLTLVRPDEPYRLFTARCESRLYCREDNSLTRISPYRASLELSTGHDRKLRELLLEQNLLDQVINSYKNNNYQVTILDKVRDPKLDPIAELQAFVNDSDLLIDERVIKSVALSTKYDGYIKKSNDAFERVQKLETKSLSWEELLQDNNISFECKQRIARFRPLTFGDLKRMEGIRKATLSIVAAKIC